MPLHDLANVQYLVSEDAWELATDRAHDAVRSLGLTRQNVQAMLLALKPQDLRSEWGVASSDFGDIQVDDYLLWYDEEGKARCSPYRGNCFYIKLGIHSDSEGDACLVVSFHLESRP